MTAIAVLAATCALPSGAVAATNWTVGLAANSHGHAAASTVSPPSSVSATCTGLTTPIVVSWSAVANAASYTVYQSTGGGAFTSATTISAPTTTWHYSPPGLLQTYAFKVLATVGTNWTSALSGATATRSITVLLVCT